MFHKPVICTVFLYKYCGTKKIIVRNYTIIPWNLISRNFSILPIHDETKQTSFSRNFYLIFLLNSRKIVAFPGLSKYITQDWIRKGKPKGDSYLPKEKRHIWIWRQIYQVSRISPTPTKPNPTSLWGHKSRSEIDFEEKIKWNFFSRKKILFSDVMTTK